MNPAIIINNESFLLSGQKFVEHVFSTFWGFISFLSVFVTYNHSLYSNFIIYGELGTELVAKWRILGGKGSCISPEGKR